MKRAILTAVLVLYAGLACAAEQTVTLRSLRGTTPIEKTPPADVYRPEKDHPPTPRDFVQQPPLVPHSTERYQITKNFNKCMDCHSWSRYKQEGATKVSLTHFKDSGGTELENISPRRYFCDQCHVSQTDAKPLVNNTFRRAEALRPPAGER